MQYSVMNLSDVMDENPFFRIDAEYRKQEYISLRNKIKKHKNCLLKSITTTIRKGIFDISPNDYLNDGIPFIRVQNIKNDFLSPSECVFISKEYSNKERKTSLVEGDIAISKVGSIGNVCLVMGEANTSQNVISIKTKRDCINSFYLFAYLSSESGQNLMKQIQAIQVQSKLELHEVRNFPVPVFGDFFQNRIELILRQSFAIKNDSVSKYTQAQTLLLSELGLADWQQKHQLIFIKDYSDTRQAERVDAEYFQPKYEEIVKVIKSYPGGWDTLGNLANLKAQNYHPKNKQEYKYVELANIAGNGEIADCMTEEGQNLPSRARRKVSMRGDVIVSSIEGSLDSVALIEQEYDQALCSTGFHVVNPSVFNSETFLVLLKSMIGQLQLKKGCSGTILTAINKDELAKVVFPKIKEETQVEIQQKVRESFRLRKQSKHLLECAKHAVEIAIEQDEQTALEWLAEKLCATGQPE